ncbi:hypothetical protein [Smaragdicoccus niigatensis]|uniref:hypothetical protein n=1 Tax=Smaragdicoccus niigatensis TaxID=359359 RepID=UPI0003631981|nr:hypothetical protein [Smaragdicoccus niigatensis]
MRPVNILSNNELRGEFFAFGELAQQLRIEGLQRASRHMAARQRACLGEMTRRAELN